MHPAPKARSARAVFLAVALGALVAASGCAQPSVDAATGRSWTRGRMRPERAQAAATPARGGCELVERAGECRLESASALDDEATGDREVLAVYAVIEGAPLRIERRYRVAYLAGAEASHVALLRAHPVVACRWQTVVRGACQPYAGSVDAPEAPGVERRHHGRHHGHANVFAERSAHGRRRSR